MRRITLLALSIIFLLLPATVKANSADSLPHGVFVLGVNYTYKWANERYGNEFGTDTVSIVKDYEVEIKANDLMPVFNDDDLLGRIDPTYESYGMEVNITTGIGITDAITALVIVPIGMTHINFNLDLKDSNMYLIRDKDNNPYLVANEEGRKNYPNSEGHTVSKHPLNQEQLREAISCTADTPLCQFRYDPVKNLHRWGMGEIRAGLRYKFYETDFFRQALTLYTIWPTGSHKEPNDLIDQNWGDSQLDVGFWYGFDVMPFAGLANNLAADKSEHLRFFLKSFVFNLTLGFTQQLPDLEDRRIWVRTFNPETQREEGINPLTPHWQRMKVHRDIGGNWDVYTGIGFSPVHFLNYSNEFYFFWKYEDHITAAEPIPRDPEGNIWTPDLRSLEVGTNQVAIEMTHSLGVNTLTWFSRGKFPIPMIFSVGMGLTVAGKDFERNWKLFASLDLAGSIYMFDMLAEEGEEEKKKVNEEELDELKLPGRTDQGSGWQGPFAAKKTAESERLQKAAEFYQRNSQVEHLKW